MAVTKRASEPSGKQATKETGGNNRTGIVLIINTVILFVVSLLVIYYIVQSNIIAASNYKIDLLNQKLESLNETRGSLAAQKSSMEDPAKVLDFALSQNMVEAKNAVYLFENGDVALKP